MMAPSEEPHPARKGGPMTRQVTFSALALAVLSGCATIVHGPYQDVTIDSNPPGAQATVSAQTSERGPLFVDKNKQTITTPATIRLRRDNNYRVELEKPGYKIGTSDVVSEYDWRWAPSRRTTCQSTRCRSASWRPRSTSIQSVCCAPSVMACASSAPTRCSGTRSS